MFIDEFSIASHYKNLLENLNFQIHDIGISVRIPHFSHKILSKLCERSVHLLEQTPTLLKLKGSFVIVGDLHGSLHDLLQIFKQFGFPPSQSYLFLGDYVDRGEFSIETISLLLSLMISYPDHIFLLRGNHEFYEVCHSYGFKDELESNYKNKFLIDQFCNVFAYMPLGAIINDSIFCVHGGLSPQLHSVSQLESIDRPIRTFSSNKLVEDILWSDPALDINDNFIESNRGRGFDYGLFPLMAFLQENNLKHLIRGHQCVMNGVFHNFHHLLTTVFSSSSYEDLETNKCGVLIIDNSNDIKSFVFNDTWKIPRSQAKFYRIKKFKQKHSGSSKVKVSQCRCVKTFGLIFAPSAISKQRSWHCLALSKKELENQ